MEPVEILDKVIENYESGEVIWRQYGPNDTKMGGLCVQQATWDAFAGMGGSNISPYVGAISPYVGALKAVRTHVGYETIPTWNDDPELTFSQMLDTLKTVANGLRSNT